MDSELTSLDDEVARLDHLLSGPGLEARPVTPVEMRTLLTRSCALGMPTSSVQPAAPDVPWEPEDLDAVTATADLVQEPYAPTVTVIGRTGPYAGIERDVAVLSLGMMHGLHIPEIDEPWAQRVDRLPAAVEWSARIYVRRPDEVEGELQRLSTKVRSQMSHFSEEHNLEPPRSLARQYQLVQEVDDQLTSGYTALGTRVKSWWRLAVSAPTRREALHLAQRVADLYKPKVAIEHPEAQYKLAREFIPGEPLATSAHQRRGSVVWLASAVPAATAEVGDRQGILLDDLCQVVSCAGVLYEHEARVSMIIV
ncbi:hypothetical protein GCM10029964_060910 [Kibdelosporangium lantanae]